MTRIIDANGNAGWQARVGKKGPGKTKYFAESKWGRREAKQLAKEAFVIMQASHRPGRRRREA